MNSKIIVLFAKPWSMRDDVTGATREGVTIQYLMTDSMKAIADQDEGSLGIQVAKASLDLDKQKNLIEAPAIYDCEFIMATSQGKTVLKPHDLKYVGPVFKEK